MSGEEKSPGRAACEAFWAYMGTGPDGQPPSAAWDWAGSQGTRGAWMAASQAAAEATERIRRGQPAPAVTVCSECGTESCWQGVLMCENARSAGTVITDGT
jgi:hypothetical protein